MPYDVLFMDLQMPELEACLVAGMDDYVSKPLKTETLEAALTRAERIPAHG